MLGGVEEGVIGMGAESPEIPVWTGLAQEMRALTFSSSHASGRNNDVIIVKWYLIIIHRSGGE